MNRFIARWFAGLTTNRKPCTARRSRLGLEVLERRDVPTVSFNDGILTVTGTDGPELLAVVPNPDDASEVRVIIAPLAADGFTPIGDPADWEQGDFDLDDVERIVIFAQGGNDILGTTTSIPAELNGGAGIDTLRGGGADDILTGGGDADTYLFNPAGLTTLGHDTVVETEQDTAADRLDFFSIPQGITVDLALATPQPVAGVLTLTLNGLLENVSGTPFADVIRGNAKDNRLSGNEGADTLEGRQGDDDLFGGNQNDTYVFANPNHENLGADEISETSADPHDLLDFHGLDRRIVIDLARTGNQPMLSNAVLTLSQSPTVAIDDVLGTSFNDVIQGNALDNTLHGLAGADILEGRAGNDVLRGGQHGDVFVFNNQNQVDLGSDAIDDTGTQGRDVLDFLPMDRGVTVDIASVNTFQLVAGDRLTLLLTGQTIEDVYGSRFGDSLRGNNLGNLIFGMEGNDTLLGRGGADDLSGGADNDTLRGGGGTDVLRGGTGADFLDGGTDGLTDLLFGNDLANNQDNAVDTFLVRLRRRGALLVPTNEERVVGRRPDRVQTLII